MFTDITHAIVCSAQHLVRNLLVVESAPTLPPPIALPSHSDDGGGAALATIDATTLISIVIPAYNEGGCIRDTILAALTDTHVEVILMDGGSTDSTCDIATDAGAHGMLCWYTREKHRRRVRRVKIPTTESVCSYRAYRWRPSP